MKKILLLFIINLTVLSVYANQFSLETVLDNPGITFNQIKKADWVEKYNVMRFKLRVIPSQESVNWQLYLLKFIPREQMADRDALANLLETVEDKSSFEFWQNRLGEDFNIYYEGNIKKNKPLDDDSLYDFYKDYRKNKGIANIKNLSFEEKKSLLEEYLIPMNDIALYYDLTDDYVNRAFELLEIYFSLDEFQRFEAPKKRYNIYRLGKGILNRLNDYSYPFILKKLSDKNTNLENLAYFLEKVDFNMYMTPEGEKEFDDGKFAPKEKFLPSSEYYLSQVIAYTSNYTAEYLESIGLKCSTKQRLIALHINQPKEKIAEVINSVAKHNELTSDEKINISIKILLAKDEEEQLKLMEYVQKNWFKMLLEY